MPTAECRLRGVLLVHNAAAKGDKLLFAHPPREHQIESPAVVEYIVPFQHTVSPSTSGADKEDYTCGLPDTIIAHLFTVRPELCAKPFELKLNATRFVSFPVQVVDRDAAAENLLHERHVMPTAKLAVVFVLSAAASKSVVVGIQRLSKQIALALLHEEKRVAYLSLQAHIMNKCHEECAQMAECDTADPFELMVTRSKLAANLRQVYEDVNERGMVHLHVNDLVRVSFCLPQKVFLLRGLRPFTTDDIESTLRKVRPYHTLLLLEGVSEIEASLPADPSPSLLQLLDVLTPLRSLQQLTADAHLPYAQGFVLVRELLLWAKALIILPLSEANVYCIAEDALITRSLSIAFHDTFDFSLASVLSSFSCPSSLGEFVQPIIADKEKQAVRVQMVLWMLSKQLIEQLHTYVYLLESSQVQLALQKEGTVDREVVPALTKAMHHFSEDTQAAIIYQCDQLSRQIGDPREFLTEQETFATLLPYMNGKLHLEEIMYRLNIGRPTMQRSLDRWLPVLVCAQHRDTHFS